jgi:hypothetical protein
MLYVLASEVVRSDWSAVFSQALRYSYTASRIMAIHNREEFVREFDDMTART